MEFLRQLARAPTRAWLALGLTIFLSVAHAMTPSSEIQVAVAANFANVAQTLAQSFGKTHGVRIRITQGSTGKLGAQIRNGAPFDVLLAADAASVDGLESVGLAIRGSSFTYAIGRLALWSLQPDRVKDGVTVLRQGQFQHLAIATPHSAPYGAAALEVLGRVGLLETLTPKLVQGESVAQTYGFVASGNAEIGFVAWSQIVEPGAEPRLRTGSAWLVPEPLHAPLTQNAALLSHGATNQAARAFLEYLRQPEVKALIRSYGYRTP